MFLSQGLLLTLELDQQPSVPSHPPISTSESAEVIDMCMAVPGYLIGDWDLNSGSQVCMPNSLVH